MVWLSACADLSADAGALSAGGAGQAGVDAPAGGAAHVGANAGRSSGGATAAAAGVNAGTGGAAPAGNTAESAGRTATAQASAGAMLLAGGSAEAGRAESGRGGAAAGVSGAAGMIAHGGPWRIEPLGDSITESTCTTQLLWKVLREAGRSNFDLVGTRQNQQSCGVNNPDRDCEGHSGYLVTDLVAGKAHAAELPQWCSADHGEVVLMHFGTNDVWNNVAPDVILSAFTVVVAALRGATPNVKLLVAQIIPLHPSNCAECAARAQALNARIPGWAASTATQASPVWVVDQWTGFDADKDADDGVHPNLRGSQKMADVWAAALSAHGIL